MRTAPAFLPPEPICALIAEAFPAEMARDRGGILRGQRDSPLRHSDAVASAAAPWPANSCSRMTSSRGIAVCRRSLSSAGLTIAGYIWNALCQR